MAEKLVDPLRYESAQDVKQRLDNTFIRYKGEVVKVTWYDELTLRVLPLTEESSIAPQGKVVHSSSDNLDISSIRLGFLSGMEKKAPVIVRRKPVRRYKQGVCVANMDAIGWRGPDVEVAGWGEREFQALTASPSFVYMLMDKYPTVTEAIGYMKVASTIPSMHYAAISKDFCFASVKGGTIYLLDNGFEIVGTFNKDTGKLEVNEWWATPTMMDYLRIIGVPLKEA